MTRLGGIATPLVLVAALVAGIWLGGHPDLLPGPLNRALAREPATLNEEVLDEVEASYYRAVIRRSLEDASAQAIVRQLRKQYRDRFSHYFDPASYADFQEATNGAFSGVGLAVSQHRRGLRVAEVFDGAPAERADMRRGDIVTAVDGESIAGLSAEVATAKIKGPPGTRVALTVLRPATKRRREIELQRARVAVPVVEGRLRRLGGGHSAAYVRLVSFSDGAHGQLREQIERLDKKGADALVLDLRGNGGGLLNEAVLVASIFVAREEVVVTTAGRTRSRRILRSTGEQVRARPTVILVNGDTASASEIVAAALREHGLAQLIGERSFGKGVFQEVIELSNGGALDLTVGEYFTPKGRSLAGRGVRPDVRIEDDPHTRRDEALAVALAGLRRAVR